MSLGRRVLRHAAPKIGRGHAHDVFEIGESRCGRRATPSASSSAPASVGPSPAASPCVPPGGSRGRDALPELRFVAEERDAHRRKSGLKKSAREIGTFLRDHQALRCHRPCSKLTQSAGGGYTGSVSLTPAAPSGRAGKPISAASPRPCRRRGRFCPRGPRRPRS